MSRILISNSSESPVPGAAGQTLRSGIRKQAQNKGTNLTLEGLAGDHIVDRRFHGGPDQALLVMGEADYRFWELGEGAAPALGPLARGLFGENLTLHGWSSFDACVGDQLIGPDWHIEITAPRSPCNTFNKVMRSRIGGWADRFRAAERPGAYVRVLSPGFIEAGQTVSLQPWQGERIRIADMLHLKWKTLARDAELEQLLRLPISERERKGLTARLNGVAGL